MALTQQTFMGASIRSFNCQIGWNGESSTLNVDLAVDASHGDTYPTAIIGAPAYFSFLNEDATHTFRFGGIVQSFSANGGVDGLPLYATTVKSPTDILEMARVILNSYNGSVAGIPNVFNIYGYIENNLGFGAAGVNQYGIPWSSILLGINDLINGAGNAFYGGPYVTYRGYNYIFDLSGLPTPPADYRISGDNLSLLEIVQQLCDDAGCDFFVSLYNNGLVNVVQVTTVSRAQQPTIGQIQQFINSTTGVNAKSFGTELRNEDTSMLLLGGKKTDLFVVKQKVYSKTYGTLDLDNITATLPVYSPPINAQVFKVGDFVMTAGANPILVFDPAWPIFAGVQTTFRLLDDGVWYSDIATPADPNVAQFFLGLVADGNFITVQIMKYTPVFDENGTITHWSQSVEGSFQFNDEYEDVGANIIQFWGYDSTIFPQIDPRGGKIDSRGWDVIGIGSDYLFDIGEMRAALTDQDAWESYLDLKAQRYVYMNSFPPLVTPNSLFDIQVSEFAYNTVNNLNIVADIHVNPDDIAATTIDGIAAELVNTKDFLNVGEGRLKAAADVGIEDTQANISKLYNHVRGFAEEYYGRRFLTKVPDFQYKYDSVEDRFVFSNEITDSAFAAASGMLLGLPPDQFYKFQKEDGRFPAILRFMNSINVNFFNLSPEDYVLADQKRLYVKCDVQPEFVIYHNSGTTYSVFAECQIPSRVFYQDSYEEFTENYAELVKLIADKKGLTNPTTNAPWTTDQIRSSVLSQFWQQDRFAGVHNSLSPQAVLPDAAIIPMISNIERYGPWYNVGAIGKTRVEIDDNLVPWNFGSFTAMNQAALSKVTYSTTQLQISEHGELVLPGAPRLNLGDVLVFGGPNVTSINTSFGTDGVKTTYSLRTYTPKLKIYDRTLNERIENVQNQVRNLNKRIFAAQGSKNLSDRASVRGQTRWAADGALLAQRTPHDLVGSVRAPLNSQIAFEPGTLALPSGINNANDMLSGVLTRNRIASARYQEVSNMLQAGSDEYKYRCLSSMDTLYSIFSTDPFNSGLPHFINGSGDGAVNRGSLNPFKTGQRYEFLTWGDTYPESGLKTGASYFEENKVRGMGWRLPAIGVGWGFDLSDNPVPADTGNPSAFASGYLNDARLWKAGPIDLRWDQSRGVWTTKSSNVDPYVVIAHSGYFYDNTLNRDARPRYIVRKIDNIQATGCGLIYTNPSVLPALVSSGTVIDRIVFNLQENYGDLHTVGLGSPVLLYDKFGQYFFNELPRTFARTDHY